MPILHMQASPVQYNYGVKIFIGIGILHPLKCQTNKKIHTILV